MSAQQNKPDYIFEISWEVCNKVGGIHTVIASKANTIVREFKNNYILIGPDIFRDYHNPEFTEDHQLFLSWRVRLAEEGLRVRIGRWNIPGKPIVCAVDFTPYFQQKDKIFAKFWETYKLDSISGQWDYIEPALFGYAAALVIESYTKFYLSNTDKIIAHFHEWMTGTGVLYLKEFVPQIGTVFTTHATVLGRCLAGNNRPLYNNLQQYNPFDTAREFNVISKQSLESIAVRETDVFTTVSGLTSRECEHFLGKPVDVITHNGFENSFVPQGKAYTEKRKAARQRLHEISEAMLGYKLASDALLVCVSGRYEFKNKGIDVFIDSLGKLLSSHDLKKEIAAFVLIPANHRDARKELLEAYEKGEKTTMHPTCLSHNMHEIENDAILQRIEKNGLYNTENEKVKIFYIPAYLNGNDGFVNMPYYDILIGMDVSVFPSYYEPWGYTPQESIMFKIPTIITSLSGFSDWVKSTGKQTGEGITIIERNDFNDDEVINTIYAALLHFSNLSQDQIIQAGEMAQSIASMSLWDIFIAKYYEAYARALNKVGERSHLFRNIAQTEQSIIAKKKIINQPRWNTLNIYTNLPDSIARLRELSMNMWWSWNEDAIALFADIDDTLWKKSGSNPIALFESVSFKRLQELEKDKDYIERFNKVYARFKDYMHTPMPDNQPQIAYYSMEFGIHNSIKIYSGGLGLLAGDYLKEASDANFNMIAIGLRYTYGYFKQLLSINGEQISTGEILNYSKLPITLMKDENGNPLTTEIGLPGRNLKIQVWRVDVGRVPLFLLDTDINENTPEDRAITHNLYGGDYENRLKQEIVLGIGGIRILEVLHIKPDIYHCNEGHAAFIGLERLRKLITEDHLSFSEAKEVVRASSLFTTHTPVPAGHDAFTEDMLRTYFSHYPQRYNISWEEFLSLGKSEDYEHYEKFNMSHLASNLSQEVNAVSMLHSKVSKDILACLWKGYLPEELHVGYVTNGVHLATWAAKEWKELYEKTFGADFYINQLDFDRWKKIHTVPDEEIWKIRQTLRKGLIDHIKDRFTDKWIKRHEHPEQILKITSSLNKEALTIGFARRFATYKRAHLLFRNLDRLAKIVNNPKKPVQFIFAGKAHPHDKAGQDLISMIVNISKRPEFIGKIIFLYNYDIELAKKLVQGVDVWMNTPTRPLEASGTSGEKAVMNGVIHFSVLDGWWVEGYKPGAGWMLPQEASYDDNNLQDELDAETIYNTLENEIIPTFYKKNTKGFSEGWVKIIKNNIAEVAPNFTTRRMIRDYNDRFYSKLYERTLRMKSNNYALAGQLAAWKRKLIRSWESIEVVSKNIFGGENQVFHIGKEYLAEVVLNLNEISPEYIGVEIVYTDNNKKFIGRDEFDMISYKNGRATYTTTITPSVAGDMNYGIRVFPKHPELPHRQDFSYVKWI